MIELLVNVTPSETRVALVEQGILQEIYVERSSTASMVGNIYRGKVMRVLPGMQAAFVDIGHDKAAFLHASDIVPHTECVNPKEKEHFKAADISSLVRQGQDVFVQVVKDPISTKGARLTTDITLPSRYLVFIPDSAHVGVSQKIDDAQERLRLKNIIGAYVDKSVGGFIVRTAADGVSEQELAQDANFLKRLWINIRNSYKTVKAGTLLHEDLSIEFRLLRDFVGTSLDKIKVDSKITYIELTKFCGDFVPEAVDKIEHYQGNTPLFDLYDVENEIQRALERRVELKSGGSLIIDQTEAMTTIDVNTGAFVGHHNLEETIFNTNLEATSSIARQLRLRNLGGIIIIDFIDMLSQTHRERVMSSLLSEISKDRAKTTVCNFSELGLVEMTRKRTRESLGHLLCCECPECKGRGSVKTISSVCYEILREVLRVNRAYKADKFIVYASNDVANALMLDEQHSVGELEVFIGKQIEIHSEPLYRREKFDVVMM
jgi:ribonuclease G